MSESSPDLRTNSREWGYIAAGVAVTIAALVLRLYQIGQDELWFDEAFSFHMVTISKWPEALLKDNTPPLYYVLLRAWIGCFGESESAIRSLSAISGAMFIAVIFWFANEILERRAALFCVSFSALAPMQIYYSQEARVYATLIFFIVLSYAALWRSLETEKLRWWTLFTVCVLLALYSHYFAILAVAPTVFLVGVWDDAEKSKRLWSQYFMSLGTALLLFLPWLLWSLPKITGSLATIDWIRVWWAQDPLLVVPKSIEIFTLGSHAEFISVINVKRFRELLFPDGLRLIGLTAAVILLLAAAMSRNDGGSRVPRVKISLWLWISLLFPLLTLWAISFYHPVYVVGRYDILAFPAYALLLATGWSHIRNFEKGGPLFAALLTLALFLPVGVKVVNYFSVPPDGYSRPTVRALRQYVRNQDVLVLTRERAEMTIYYLTRVGYRWKDGMCSDAAGEHKFICLIFPPESLSGVSSGTDTRQLSRTVEEWSQKLVSHLHSTDGVLWLVVQGDIFSKDELETMGPLSSLVKLLESAGFHGSPIDIEYGIVAFQGRP
jgi:4-amino-4-deoxy-L-arabinose transferase-like glycosyltransferase